LARCGRRAGAGCNRNAEKKSNIVAPNVDVKKRRKEAETENDGRQREGEWTRIQKHRGGDINGKSPERGTRRREGEGTGSNTSVSRRYENAT